MDINPNIINRDSLEVVEELLKSNKAVIYKENSYSDDQRIMLYNKYKLYKKFKLQLDDRILQAENFEETYEKRFFDRNASILYEIINTICSKNIENKECCLFIHYFLAYDINDENMRKLCKLQGFKIYKGINYISCEFGSQALIIVAKGILMKDINEYIKLEKDLYISIDRMNFIKNYKKKIIRIKAEDKCDYEFYQAICHTDWGAEANRLSAEMIKLQL